MSIEMTMGMQAELQRLLLKDSVSEFFVREADLLDARKFDDWLALLSDDIRYWMPMARNVAMDDFDREFTAEGLDANWMDEGIETLRQRVAQLATGVHWAEQPPSRTTHMISNLQIMSVEPDAAAPQLVTTRCRFLVYRNRLETEQDVFIGKRNDTLRREAKDWRLVRREIYLDQNVMLAKNISVFF
ncbi:MAG: 3-phenylpropionate/cinnamic acid dioxygenase subunit beta [Alphaproteobacteria bacterium]|nr:3-phenylpropionate/cinnamic acid dioxygenase subunit beta [Alphaproteobacteria bacterium]